MILRKGKYLCVLCGEEVGVLPGQRPKVVIKTFGGKPNMRVITLGDRELHACAMGTSWENRAKAP